MIKLTKATNFGGFEIYACNIYTIQYGPYGNGSNKQGDGRLICQPEYFVQLLNLKIHHLSARLSPTAEILPPFFTLYCTAFSNDRKSLYGLFYF